MPFRKHISTGEVRDIDQAILDGWEAASNPKLQVWEAYTPPEPEPVEEPYPLEVGSFQIRAALVARGWVTITNPDDPDADLDTWALNLINTYISDPQQRMVARMGWRNASGYKFHNEFIVLICAALGKTKEDRKDLFRTADTF